MSRLVIEHTFTRSDDCTVQSTCTNGMSLLRSVPLTDFVGLFRSNDVGTDVDGVSM